MKLQRKSASKWKKVGIYRTQGAAETRTFAVKAGTYRIKVFARPEGADHQGVRLRPDPTSVAVSNPAPPDTTAPASVTGLAVTGRTATSITLSWTNPADADLASVIVHELPRPRPRPPPRRGPVSACLR